MTALALALALAAGLGAPEPRDKPASIAAGAPASWPRVPLLERIVVPAPPGFDRDQRPLGARAAMLSLTDGSDTVVVSVYSDGAPDALRIHREELQKAIGAGPSTATSRRFLGKRRQAERLSSLFEGAEIEAEVTAADLGSRTVVVTFVRVKGGPNTTTIDQIVAGVALDPRGKVP
ncbi:MAG: hypothetical protein IT385_12970 [Deltaproteobacteria bacterium]|nr:hypothetical protein [Deltaproteobacteria bacterium]